METILMIHPRDNVAVALRKLTAGELATAPDIVPFPVLEEIPASHKVALHDIAAGENIVKYGEAVAVSARAIRKGEWVHTHNLESGKWKK
jgi:altronate hydrolase